MDFSKLKFKNGSSKDGTSRPLYSQLLEALESAIERGELTIGTRLPSERALADQLNLSRTTVINAYRELEARGLVHSHVGRGTFVCARPEGNGAPFAWRGKVSRAASLHDNPALRHLIRGAISPDLLAGPARAAAANSSREKYRSPVIPRQRRSDPEEALG